MRSLAFLVFFLLVGTGVASQALSSNQGLAKISDGDAKETSAARKLKDQRCVTEIYRDKRSTERLLMEDYPQFDPSPSSKATVKAGPIEHGTPLMPYIPNPTPPSHPRHGTP